MSNRIKLRTAAFSMKAIILSDDPAFASNAASTLARLGRQAGVNVHWTTKSWSISALQEPAVAENALVEASNAHLILFPEYRVHSLPHWICDWLAHWASVRTIRDAAVGVIKGENTANFAAPTFSELSRFTREHGLTFIVDENRPAKKSVRLPVQFPSERMVALHIAQTNPVVLATPVSHRGFGINE